MKRGDLVTHPVYWDKTRRVQAVVRRVHRDGSLTVEQRFLLDKSGEREGSYLGYKLRMPSSTFQPST